MRSGSTVILNQNVAARRIQPAVDRPLEPGAHIDRYLVLERIGGGGMGVVYRARDTELDREVALKVLTRAQYQQPEALARFRAEAQAQARLRSPHIVTLYSMLELPIGTVLVLEYLEGQTLERRLRTGGPLAPGEAVAVFEQALLGLEHVHDMGVIHRDLKPSNLFLTREGQVKIMDFSVAKLASRDAYPPRTMVGTLLYIAPEQISGRATDERSDIYALGMSLYEAVTGRLPFERRTDYGLMHAHVQESPPRPRDFAPEIPAALERVILKAIEKEPERRYRTAAEFRNALVKAAPADYRRKRAALPANAYGPVPPVSARKSALRVCAGILLDLVLVGTVVALLYALTLGTEEAVVPDAPQTAAPAPTAPPPARAAAAPASRSAAAAPPRAPAAAAPRAKPPRAAPRKPAPRAPDRYKSLKQAWGE